MLAGRAIAASWGKRDWDRWMRDQTPRVSAPPCEVVLYKRSAEASRVDAEAGPGRKPHMRGSLRDRLAGERLKKRMGDIQQLAAPIALLVYTCAHSAERASAC